MRGKTGAVSERLSPFANVDRAQSSTFEGEEGSDVGKAAAHLSLLSPNPAAHYDREWPGSVDIPAIILSVLWIADHS
jgi:hypothetical protein